MKSQHPHIDKLLKAIADPTRRKIFHALVIAGAAMPITQITEQFDISRQGVTKHIMTLERTGLVSLARQGREQYCMAQPAQLKLVYDWLGFYEKFWDDSLDNLGEYLNSQ
jgi:DNA-binding transcriptional ArsR family regulator